MELEITKFFESCTPRKYSASKVELGDFAGQITWRNALNDGKTMFNILDTAEKRKAFRAFVKSCGGWSDKEIQAWTNAELNAICLQWIAGDIRESMYLDNDPVDWAAYEADENERHNIFRSADGKIYFSIWS